MTTDLERRRTALKVGIGAAAAAGLLAGWAYFDAHPGVSQAALESGDALGVGDALGAGDALGVGDDDHQQGETATSRAHKSRGS